MKSYSPEDIMKAIVDSKSRTIFSSIAKGLEDNDNLKQMHGFTKKQFYSRTGRMLKIGLIVRSRGKFSLTCFGLVVYHAQLQIENALNNYWKLKAIDSIQSSGQIGEEERTKLIKTILSDQMIESILVRNR